MSYDAALKQLILSSRLIPVLTGSSVAAELPVEMPEVQALRPDVVLRLADGRLFHLELQSKQDAQMPRRMLSYYTALWEHFNELPQQLVLYVGWAKTAMKASIEHPQLRFDCAVRDIRTLEAEPFLESDAVPDQILAVLCNGGAKLEVIRRILSRVERLQGHERQDALAQLLILSGLRRSRAVVAEEVKHMPLEIEDNEFLMEIFHQGEMRGAANLVKDLLAHRFGPLPKWVLERIATASPELLRQWAEEAPRVEDLATLLGKL